LNANVHLLPSVVDTDHFRPAESLKAQSLEVPFTVGWIGSPSTSTYLQLLVNPLEQLATERPVRLLVVGGASPIISGVEIIEAVWSLDTEVSLIQTFDVGVMPLPDNEWTRGKCAYKLIQCMSCGIPVVASPVGANIDVVPADCGFLPESSEEWLLALRHLASEPALRRRLGASARHWVEHNYSLLSTIPIFCDVIKLASSSLHI
jgi:glycosyltransferase involved in cell wall biosynthesis